MKKFLSRVGRCIDYLSWHQYNINGHSANVEDFLNFSTFNHFISQVNIVNHILESNTVKLSHWLCKYFNIQIIQLFICILIFFILMYFIHKYKKNRKV